MRWLTTRAYALTGGLYSRSPGTSRRPETFDVGNLYINRPITGAWSIGSRSAGTGFRAWVSRPEETST